MLKVSKLHENLVKFMIHHDTWNNNWTLNKWIRWYNMKIPEKCYYYEPIPSFVLILNFSPIHFQQTIPI